MLPPSNRRQLETPCKIPEGSEAGALGVASVPDSVNVGKFTYTSKCKRDIGYVVDALVFDLEKGRNDQSMEVQGKYYEGAVDVGQEEITSQAFSHIKSIAESLLNVAAPIGASIIISKGDAILSGECSSFSQSLERFGILRLETLKPTKPILGFAPLPVAPSSLISPPDPVAAPG